MFSSFKRKILFSRVIAKAKMQEEMGNQVAVYAPEKVKGVLYAYAPVGSYLESGPQGRGKGIYYFGRSRQDVVYDLSLDGLEDGVQERQKRMLMRRCGRTGLHSPDRVLLWGRSTDLNRDWEVFKDVLRGNHFVEDLPDLPKMKNELWIGDNWWICESLARQAFGFYLRRTWNVLHANRPNEKVIVERPVVQDLGNGDVLLSNVSSDFAARVMCGLDPIRDLQIVSNDAV